MVASPLRRQQAVPAGIGIDSLPRHASLGYGLSHAILAGNLVPLAALAVRPGVVVTDGREAVSLGELIDLKDAHPP